jgi:hypothetical protein
VFQSDEFAQRPAIPQIRDLSPTQAFDVNPRVEGVLLIQLVAISTRITCLYLVSESQGLISLFAWIE